MNERPDYFKEAVKMPAHGGVLVAGGIATLIGIASHTFIPLVLFAAVEAFWLLVLPALPAFRRRCDLKFEEEKAYQKQLTLERAASRLSPTAKSRLDGVQRTCTKILDSLSTLSPSDAMAREWRTTLSDLQGAALRILVSVDANPADDRQRKMLASDVKGLEDELAKVSDGAAKEAKLQRLEMAKKRLASFAALADQREAAVTQFEMLEDQLRDLLAQPLASRDSAAFADRMTVLSERIKGAGESVAALDKQAGTESELAALKASR